jgi:hypothetical protein
MNILRLSLISVKYSAYVNLFGTFQKKSYKDATFTLSMFVALPVMIHNSLPIEWVFKNFHITKFY